MNRAAFAGLVVACSMFGTSALADEQKPIEVQVKISLRVPRPMAAIEVSRALPKLGIRDLRRPSIDNIEKVITQAPF